MAVHAVRNTSREGEGHNVVAGLIGLGRKSGEILADEIYRVLRAIVGAPQVPEGITEDMTVEMGTEVALAPNDTVLVACDGLFDNLTTDEIVELLRKGDLGESTRALVEECRARMAGACIGTCRVSRGIRPRAGCPARGTCEAGSAPVRAAGRRAPVDRAATAAGLCGCASC